MTNKLDDQIRCRAHQIWESDGRPEGRHEEHWQKAREEVEAAAGLSATEAAQIASLSGSSSDPTQPASTSEPKRVGTKTKAPSAREPDRGSGRRASRSKSSDPSSDTGATLQGSMPSELGGPRGKEPEAPPPPRYRHPENSQLTWTGRGRRPDWIREAVAAGRTLSDFEIGA